MYKRAQQCAMNVQNKRVISAQQTWKTRILSVGNECTETNRVRILTRKLGVVTILSCRTDTLHWRTLFSVCSSDGSFWQYTPFLSTN